MTDQMTTDGEPRPKRSHKGAPKAKVGSKPPHGKHRHSIKNSRTSARRIIRRKRIDEAIGYRLSGYGFAAIGKQMGISLSTAHSYITEGLDLIPAENARQLMRLELEKLDAIQAAFFGPATEGDMHAAALCLKIADQRARLTGLYPKENGPSLLAITAQDSGDGQRPLFQIEFIMPTAKPVEPEPVYEPEPRPWQRQLAPPAPAPRLRVNEWGDLVEDD
jgi:hypothetical protein